MNRPSSPWTDAATVAGFVQSPPNATLTQFAQSERDRRGRGFLLDIGCGAGRNLLPLAEQGWRAIGVDASAPMLAAALARARPEETAGARVTLALAAMDALPVADGSIDLIVAHGIWNLARSSAEFRRAIREAARAARPDAGLFVFTFSRHTLPPAARPVAGETFVFTDFSGQPQCFLTDVELLAELAAAGFEPDPAVPLREHNRRAAGVQMQAGPPVIHEAAFRYSVR